MRVYMGVSENSGTPKSSILIGFSIINHPFWGAPIFGNIHILFGEDFHWWKLHRSSKFLMRSNEIHKRLLESMFGAFNRYTDTPKNDHMLWGDTEKDENDDDDDDDDDDVKLQEVSFPFLTTTAWDPCFKQILGSWYPPWNWERVFPWKSRVGRWKQLPFGSKLGPFQEQTFLLVLGRVLKGSSQLVNGSSPWFITPLRIRACSSRTPKWPKFMAYKREVILPTFSQRHLPGFGLTRCDRSGGASGT